MSCTHTTAHLSFTESRLAIQRMIDVGAIEEQHIRKGAPVFVEGVSLEGDFFTKHEVGRSSFDLHLQGASTLCVTDNDASTTTGGSVTMASTSSAKKYSESDGQRTLKRRLIYAPQG